MTIAQPPAGVARDQLEALAGVVEDLAGQFDLRPLLDRILRHAAELLGCDSGSICTVDQQAGSYRKEVDLGVSCRSGNEFPLTEGVTGEILRAGGPVTFAEYSEVRGGHIDPLDRRDLHGTIGVPIRWAGSVIGTCIVFSRDSARRFGPDDVTLLELFAGHAGLAIVNARMHARAAELARAEATGLERERVVRDVHDSVARALASVVLHLDSAGDPTVPTVASDGSAAGPTGGAGASALGGASTVGGGRPELTAVTDTSHLDLARQAARVALLHTTQPLSGAPTTRPAARTAVEDAIQAEVDRARRTGLDIRLVVAGPRRTLPGQLGNELVALGRQAIANIVAHADARTARVGLVYGVAEAVLLVQDDGVGFDLAEVPRPDGSRVGLRGPGLPELAEISERAKALGGTVQIDATPGWGTTIRAAIPFRSTDGGSPPAEPTRRPTVLVAEHRPLVRAGLLSLLQEHGDLVQVVGEVTDAGEVVEAVRLLTPDVVLIDVALPSGGPTLTASLTSSRTGAPATAVIVIGEQTAGDPRVREMLRAGARGVVMIDADAATLCRAVTAAARGDALFTDEVLHGLYDGPAAEADEQPALTPREREVRALVAQGLPDKRIAELLHISVKTVEKHVGAALRKAGARNRTELATMTGRETA